MGLFDSIKDALTTDDAERYEAATNKLEKAEADLAKTREQYGSKDDPMSRGRVDNAQHAVDKLRAEVDELATKAGINTPDTAVEAPAPTEARREADTAAVERIKEQQRKYAENQQAAAEAASEQAVPDATQDPAPPAEPLVASEPALREYTVEKGDTLSAIGQKFGVKWREIADLNDVKNPDLIFPGQVFKIPHA
ncbi:MAG TPA: LysM peptidoglycan-binding domain-containing protein [Propionibacterium sp.]|nr:LysM peptidoglycan-binding domain-containing protein [Propionibacterium sp.]